MLCADVTCGEPRLAVYADSVVLLGTSGFLKHLCHFQGCFLLIPILGSWLLVVCHLGEKEKQLCVLHARDFY